MPLIDALNLTDPDGFYERLIDLHAGLDDQDSQQLNARLAQLLSEQLADPVVLRDATQLAGLGEEGGAESPYYLPKLILLLANHLGDSNHLERILSRASSA